MSTGSLEARLSVNVEQFVSNMIAAGNATQTQADRMARLLKSVQAELKQMNAAAAEAGKSPAGLEATAKGMEHVGFATAGAKRELLVLAHELSQGNYSRFGGSLLVLAERTNAMELAFSGAGLAIGVAGAAFAGFTALAIHGAMQQAEFNKAVTMTGNYAGVTAGQVDGLARSISAASALTVRAARDAIQATVATGAFGPQVLSQAAEAVGRLSSVTGQEAEKVAADFSKMRDGVAKFAVEYNRTAHNLTLAQYEQIRALEEAGKSQEAQQRVFDAVNAQLAQQDKNLGEVARGWDGLKKSISETADRIEGLGRDKTIEEGIVRQIDLINKLDKAINARPAIGSSNLRNEKFLAGSQGAAQDDLILLRRAQELKQTQALAAAEKARREEEAIAASDAIRRITLEFDQRAKMTAEIRDYRKELERLRAVKPEAVSAQQEADTIAKIREKYVDPAIKRANDEIDRLILTQKQEDARIQGQIANLRLYGRAFDDTREAAARMRLAEGNLPGVSQGKKDAYVAGAAQLDADARMKVQVEAEQQLRRNIDALQKEAAARQESIRAAYVQEQLTAKIPQALARESQAYKDGARDIAAFANARFTASTLDPAVQAITTEADGIVERIRNETEALTQGALARQLVNNQRAIELKYLQEAAKFKGDAADQAALWAKRAQEIKRVNDETVRGYKAARDWSTGVDQAVQRFLDDATNQAKNASTLVDGFLKRSEDALLNFVHTGKLNFGELFRFMADEYIRQSIRMAEASFIGNVGGQSIGDIFDGIGMLFGGSPHSLANGIGYVPYDGYPASLHEGETVLTRPEAQEYRSSKESGGATGQTIVFHVASGITHGEFAAMIPQLTEQIKNQVQWSSRRPGYVGVL